MLTTSAACGFHTPLFCHYSNGTSFRYSCQSFTKSSSTFSFLKKGEQPFIPLLYLPAYTLADCFASISHEREAIRLLFSIFPKRNALLAIPAIILMMIVHIFFTKKEKNFIFFKMHNYYPYFMNYFSQFNVKTAFFFSSKLL